MNQSRVRRLKDVGGESELVEHAGAEIVEHRIGRTDEGEKLGASCGSFQIERHALLAGVVGAELSAVATTVEVTKRIAPVRILDLDDLRTKFGEQLPGEWAADESAELENTETFRGTMVIGYYRGKPIFIEPMLTRSLLLEKRSFDLPIPSIPGMVGAYPQAFRAEYDARRQLYEFVFSDFTPAG